MDKVAGTNTRKKTNLAMFFTNIKLQVPKAFLVRRINKGLAKVVNDSMLLSENNYFHEIKQYTKL
jgi:hypothetical protein